MNDAIILCGGKGTRLSEETVGKPKPMVEIGEMPILWHIMKTYEHYGFKKFILCLDYKCYVLVFLLFCGCFIFFEKNVCMDQQQSLSD
jgi:glucose-1-phosphate cytidylyltransferase